MKKKSIFWITIIILFSNVFAENYKTLLEKGEKYESNKEYVYAMGYYYDAMKSENAGTEAEQKFDSLCSRLKKGTEGLELSLWDNPKEHWEKVLMNFYKYFTEFSPYEFYYNDNLKRGEVNYENKTATYLMECNCKLTEKFKMISDILAKGEKVEQYYTVLDDRRIPYLDIYVGSDKFKNAIKNVENWKEQEESKINMYDAKNFEKVLILSSKYDDKRNKVINEYENELRNEIIKYYQQTGIALSTNSSVNYYRLASFVSFDESHFENGKYIPYDLQFGIYDKTNKLLIKGNRQNIFGVKSRDEKYEYKFTGATEDIINLIDANEITVKPIGIYLNYGIYKTTGFKESDSDYDKMRSFIKKTAEIQISFDKVQLFSQKELQAEKERVAKQKAIEEQNLKEKKEKEAEQIKEENKRIEKERHEQEKKEQQKREQNYTDNYALLENILNEYIENFISLGFSINDYYGSTMMFSVDEVQTGSPAAKKGIKKNDQIYIEQYKGYDYSDIIDEIYIIQRCKLETLFYERLFEKEELKSYINNLLINRQYVCNVRDKKIIMPLEKGEMYTFYFSGTPLRRTINLIVPE